MQQQLLPVSMIPVTTGGRGTGVPAAWSAFMSELESPIMTSNSSPSLVSEAVNWGMVRCTGG
jgi:hypothetical protein